MGVSNVMGVASEYEHFFRTRVIEGGLVKAPTNASTQATGTGASDFNVDIDHLLAVIDGKTIEAVVQADYDLASSSTAQITNGQSRIYTIVLFRNLTDSVIKWLVVAGAAATTGSQIAPTDAEIEAKFATDTVYLRLCEVTVNRTGDTTVTQTQNNLVRNIQRPVTVHTPA